MYSAVSGHRSVPVREVWHALEGVQQVVESGPACHADQRFGFGPGLGTYAGGQSGSRNDNLQRGRHVSILQPFSWKYGIISLIRERGCAGGSASRTPPLYYISQAFTIRRTLQRKKINPIPAVTSTSQIGLILVKVSTRKVPSTISHLSQLCKSDVPSPCLSKPKTVTAIW